MASCGSWSSTARATVSPPTPESKMPMGAPLSGVPPAADVAMSQVRLAADTDADTRKAPSRDGRGPRDQALHALLEHRLPHVAALAAVGLRLAEELGQLRVAGALGVLDVQVQAQSVAQAGLG